MELTQVTKLDKGMTLSPMDRSAFEGILKNQTRAGQLMGQLADSLLETSSVISEEDFKKYGDLMEKQNGIYLSMKITGEHLYNEAVRAARILDLKNPEDSMWGY